MRHIRVFQPILLFHGLLRSFDLPPESLAHVARSEPRPTDTKNVESGESTHPGREL
jgi:hypothetical protein